MKIENFLILIPVVCMLAGCSNADNLAPAIESIDAAGLKKHISVLASDEFQGRAPATLGEEKTIQYLADQFSALGLEPGNNGSWYQEVSMIRITANEEMKFDITAGNNKVSLKFNNEFIGGTPKVTDLLKIDNSDLVFVGYGIVSPEYKWNDYEGIDVKGKTVLIMVNDPGYATGDSSLFTGNAMTYYGRWTYKYEEAARQGATGAIIIHETGAAGYPWEVVQNSWTGPQFYLEDNELSRSDLQFKGWITGEAAKKIFKSAGMDLAGLSTNAAQRGFKPVSMNIRASIQFENLVEHVKSNNVAALLKGNVKSDEYIIYTAHWDHFGINNDFEGDSILNGAVDNASGTAALLEIADAFINLPAKQERNVLFLCVTGEEQGLLGSEFYARNPVFPLEKTAAVINIDALNIFGSTLDMTVVGYGNSGLDKYAEDLLKKYKRYVSPDPTPEKGMYFRSDHFSFAKVGVPSLYLAKGVDNALNGKEWGLKQSENWIQENYHKPSDNYEPEKWDFQGMIDDIKIYFEVGYNLSMTNEFPEWNSKFPFKTVRDEMMKK